MANNKKKKTNKSNNKKTTTKKVEVTKKEPVKKEIKKEETIVPKKEEIKVTIKEKEEPKKKSKTLIVLIAIVCIMALGFVINKDDIKYEGFEIHNPDVDLEFGTFLEKMEGREDGELVFLTLFMDTKTDATLYKSMLLDEIMAEYNFPEHYVYYTNEMTASENSDLTMFLGSEVTAYPMTFLIKDGKVVDYIWGYQVYDSYTEALKEKVKDLDKYKVKTNEE